MRGGVGEIVAGGLGVLVTLLCVGVGWARVCGGIWVGRDVSYQGQLGAHDLAAGRKGGDGGGKSCLHCGSTITEQPWFFS